MKLNKLIFKDISFEWSLEDISFEKLTLLVGASGVGKTQILKTLLVLKKIAHGKSVNGLKWDIEFDTISGNSYKWEGEFDEESSSKNKNSLIYEKLYLAKKLIVDRKNGDTIF